MFLEGKGRGEGAKEVGEVVRKFRSIWVGSLDAFASVLRRSVLCRFCWSGRLDLDLSKAGSVRG